MRQLASLVIAGVMGREEAPVRQPWLAMLPGCPAGPAGMRRMRRGPGPLQALFQPILGSLSRSLGFTPAPRAPFDELLDRPGPARQRWLWRPPWRFWLCAAPLEGRRCALPPTITPCRVHRRTEPGMTVLFCLPSLQCLPLLRLLLPVVSTRRAARRPLQGCCIPSCQAALAASKVLCTGFLASVHPTEQHAAKARMLGLPPKLLRRSSNSRQHLAPKRCR